jgi:hypothetical protein
VFDDVDEEHLKKDPMNDGQSHRLRLREVLAKSQSSGPGDSASRSNYHVKHSRFVTTFDTS